MRILFIGDVVGPPGVTLLKKSLRALIAREAIDLVIANAENASGGSGITPSIYRQLRSAGVDLVTLGDHIYRKAEIIATLQSDEHICKPANYPADAPGKECAIATARSGESVAVFLIMGRTFMRPVDCPFRAADRVLKELDGRVRCIVADAHAEATGDKYLLGHYLKGRVSAVIGTHTHVQTADEQILDGGTAFISDVGMTGPYQSILGRRVDRVLHTITTFVPTAFDVATDDVRLGGAIVDVDETGRAGAIRRVMLTESELTAMTVEKPATAADTAT